jgi:hypothetical protein
MFLSFLFAYYWSSLNQSHQYWKIFKIFKNKILSCSSSKAIESLINSTYYYFLALFTNYFMNKMISPSMFNCRIISCDLRLKNYV